MFPCRELGNVYANIEASVKRGTSMSCLLKPRKVRDFVPIVSVNADEVGRPELQAGLLSDPGSTRVPGPAARRGPSGRGDGVPRPGTAMGTGRATWQALDP
ncbi:hypothetical protein Areg01_46370 [Actinoplanes regularis]|nr:hypothetical protein Areg01_46370 [Actinoplanes regularis]